MSVIENHFLFFAPAFEINFSSPAFEINFSSPAFEINFSAIKSERRFYFFIPRKFNYKDSPILSINLQFPTTILKMPPRQLELHPIFESLAEKYLCLCKVIYNFITSSRQNLEEEFNTNGKTDEFHRLRFAIFSHCEKFLSAKDNYIRECANENINSDENITYCERIVGFVWREMKILSENQDVMNMTQCSECCKKIYEENNAEPELIQAYENFINGN